MVFVESINHFTACFSGDCQNDVNVSDEAIFVMKIEIKRAFALVLDVWFPSMLSSPWDTYPAEMIQKLIKVVCYFFSLQ